MKLRKIKLKWKIFFVLAGLIAIILLLLWLFQILFLNQFYHRGREEAVRSAVQEVTENLDKLGDQEAFQIVLNRICLHYDVCMVVLEEDGTKHKGGSNLACTVLTQTADSLRELAKRAENAGGSIIEELTLSELGSDWAEEEDDAITSLSFAMVPDFAGVRVVVAEAIVPPVDSLKYTASIQNLILSVSVLLMAGLATLVMSQMIAKPIEALNITAKELAKGKTDLEFRAEGYLEIEELRDSLNYASKEISEAEHYRKELLANVSHDLKTPLALIKGYSEMMRDLPGETTPENLQVIIDETERLTGLVNDLLEVNRLQNGSDVFMPEKLVLNDLVAEIVTRVGALLQGKILLNYQEDGRYSVNADKKKIGQVVYNLISNAVNYVGEDHVVEVKVKKHNKNVRVEVQDHGEGIDVEILPRIWDRYYKSDKAHKRAYVGTGLGLSIVKHVVAMHPGGVYGVQTTRGRGSVFYFELPIAEASVN